MIKLKRVYEHEYFDLISECWSKDQDLIEKYHVCAGKGLNECVMSTVMCLKNDVDKKTFVLYKVMLGSKLIGFFGKEEIQIPLLTTFFVMPEYRKYEHMSLFVNAIKSKFEGAPFYCSLYSNNSRAINWLIKNGFVYAVAAKKEDKIVLILKHF